MKLAILPWNPINKRQINNYAPSYSVIGHAVKEPITKSAVGTIVIVGFFSIFVKPINSLLKNIVNSVYILFYPDES